MVFGLPLGDLGVRRGSGERGVSLGLEHAGALDGPDHVTQREQRKENCCRNPDRAPRECLRGKPGH